MIRFNSKICFPENWKTIFFKKMLEPTSFTFQKNILNSNKHLFISLRKKNLDPKFQIKMCRGKIKIKMRRHLRILMATSKPILLENGKFETYF